MSLGILHINVHSSYRSLDSVRNSLLRSRCAVFKLSCCSGVLDLSSCASTSRRCRCDSMSFIRLRLLSNRCSFLTPGCLLPVHDLLIGSPILQYRHCQPVRYILLGTIALFFRSSSLSPLRPAREMYLITLPKWYGNCWSSMKSITSILPCV